MCPILRAKWEGGLRQVRSDTVHEDDAGVTVRSAGPDAAPMRAAMTSSTLPQVRGYAGVCVRLQGPAGAGAARFTRP